MASSGKVGRNKKKGYKSRGKNSNVRSGLLAAMRAARNPFDRVRAQLEAKLKGKDTVETVETGDPARPFERRRVSGKAFLEQRKANAYRMRGTE